MTSGNRTRHHDNDLVDDAVEHYAKAVNGRADMDPKEKKEAVAAYTERMKQIWEHPKRGGASGSSNDKSR